MSLWFKDYTLEDLNTLRGNQSACLNQFIGIVITEIGADFLKATMPVDERTRQPFGILHGGASCVLAETLGSVASWMCIDSEKYCIAGQEIHVHHLRSVSEGTITGTCTLIHRGKTTHLWQIDMCGDDGKANATARISVAVRERR